MTTANFSASVDGGEVLVRIAGEIDLANAAEVQQRIHAVITNDAIRVVLDLAGLDYLDSAGLHVLFTLAERLRLLQIGLDLVVPPGAPVRRVVELSGLAPVARVLPEQGQRRSS
ncbi:STAS domain-containing protein [Amycolatopsis alkalitolerans]|uniref:Anti-sigma factor antagonist n=1 Tax=Amycolatopsis alkalitolerans TaxID=2547244 RepID=A0A5C4M866_9PSEU|nr:STAS domain-containing protein [Amycolatopsis alkalitolerans]TNC29688.1 STAS domain-containing protein [Amycolatopsis alkalitolerans]